MFWLFVGLVFWLVLELAKGRGYGPGLAVLFVLGFILEFLLTCWLVVRVVSFVTGLSIARRASSPAESQRGDRRLTVLVVSIAVLAGLVLELMMVLSYAGSDRLTFGLGGGLGLGLTFGLVGSKACWPAFVAASLWLGTRRRLPLRLMRFLEDAYRLGLLRVVGPVYQFRHAALQDHLAPPSEVTPVAAAKGPTPP